MEISVRGGMHWGMLLSGTQEGLGQEGLPGQGSSRARATPLRQTCPSTRGSLLSLSASHGLRLPSGAAVSPGHSWARWSWPPCQGYSLGRGGCEWRVHVQSPWAGRVKQRASDPCPRAEGRSLARPGQALLPRTPGTGRRPGSLGHCGPRAAAPASSDPPPTQGGCLACYPESEWLHSKVDSRCDTHLSWGEV